MGRPRYLHRYFSRDMFAKLLNIKSADLRTSNLCAACLILSASVISQIWRHMATGQLTRHMVHSWSECLSNKPNWVITRSYHMIGSIAMVNIIDVEILMDCLLNSSHISYFFFGRERKLHNVGRRSWNPTNKWAQRLQYLATSTAFPNRLVIHAHGDPWWHQRCQIRGPQRWLKRPGRRFNGRPSSQHRPGTGADLDGTVFDQE